PCDGVRARARIRKDFEVSDHASEHEKLSIAASYYRNVTWELDKAAQTFQEQIETYPRDSIAYRFLGLVYSQQGQYQKAAEITRQALRLSSDDVFNYETLGSNLLALQRFDEAWETLQQARARKLD